MNKGICWVKIVILFLIHSCSIRGQEDAFSVRKESCTYLNKFYGSKLLLYHQNDTALKASGNYDYDLSYFISLDDSSKLALIEKLLSFEGDTSLCCLDVISRSFNGMEGCRGVSTSVFRYSIEIDALYMINRLCWPKLMELYSCFPLLYDTLNKDVINNNPLQVKQVFIDYRRWYLECKSKKRIPKYFPFNDGRFVWAGGRKSLAVKE